VDFNEARDDRVAVASAGPYANHLCLAADRQHLISQLFTGLISSWCQLSSVREL